MAALGGESPDSANMQLAFRRRRRAPVQLPATFMPSISIEPTVLPPMV
jgi:hypothetical protein